MAETTSRNGHEAGDPVESPSRYREWHLRDSKAAGSKASARPPPHAHRSGSGTSKHGRTMDIELVEAQNYDQSL